MKFKTQLTAKDIFKFSMMYSYSGTSGIFSAVMIIVGLFMCIRGITQEQDMTYLLTGALILLLLVVINPLILYQKAKKQADTHPAYQHPSYYTLEEDGIFVEVGKDKAKIGWNRVVKTRHRFGLFILYTGRQQAFVFPDADMGSQKDEMIKYMEEHVKNAKANPAGQVKGNSGISKYAKASGVETVQEDTKCESEE